MRRSWIAAWIAVAACSSEAGVLPDSGDGEGADAGFTPDAIVEVDSGSLDVGSFAPIPGGGTIGPAVAGQFTLFLLDETSGGPIAGATALIQFAGESIEAVTGAEGRVDFADAELVGPIAVHAFATGYPYASVLGVGARALTLMLRRVGAAPAESLATITGNISTFDPIPLPTSTTAVRFVLAAALSRNPLGARPEQDRRGAMGNLGTDTMVEGTFVDYSLKIDAAQTVGLAFIGGLLTRRMGRQPLIERTNLGIVPSISVAPGAVLTGQNVVLTHALDRRVEIRLENPPPELMQRRAFLELEVAGGGGIVPLGPPQLVDTATASFEAPAMTGALAGSGFVAVAVLEDGMARQSTRVVHSPETTSIAVGGFLPVPQSVAARGRELTAVFPPGATIYSFVVREMMTTRWTVEILSATPPGSVVLPAVPAGFADPLDGGRAVTASAIDFGAIDFGEVRFDSLEASLAAASTARAVVRF